MKQTSTVIALLLMTILALPMCARAQTDSWVGVQALRPGTEIFVLRKNKDKVVGVLQSATGDTIALTADEGSFVIGKANIAKIFYAVPRDKKKSMNRGALYGMLAGLGTAVAVSTMTADSDQTPGWPIFLGGGLAGMWLGKKHGAGKDKGPLIYSAR